MSRLQQSERNSVASRAFTIVELAVVIVVLAILALIVISLYDNVAVDANDASLKSELQTAADQLKLEAVGGSKYPATAEEANNGAGFNLSNGNSITYMRKPYGYCMYASNPEANKTYMIRSLDGELREGDCSMEISLFAGSGTETGYVDGTGTDARFYSVYDNGIAVNNKDDIYITDYFNNRVRKITSGAVVTTHIGSGGSGCTTGPKSTAQLGATNGIVYDNRTDIIYFMACDASRLYKMTPDGTVSSLSGGGGTSTCNTASGATTSLSGAKGLFLGGDGNLYVVATGMHKVCKINKTTGAATLVAGSSSGSANGTGSGAQFNNPWSGVMDSEGNIFITDQNNHKIRKITPAGVVSNFAGSGSNGNADGLGTAATLSSPKGIAIDRYDTLYVTTAPGIRIITKDGNVTTLKTSPDPWSSIPWPGGSFSGAIYFDSKGILYGLTMRGIVKIIV